MEYSNKRKQVNTARSIGNENASVNTNTQDPAYQAYLQAVLAGRAKADSETMGHRQDLAPSLAAKMSKAFGMDLSQMKLYRSGAMEGTETKGMASGNKIVLSKDIDLNTMAGQAVLGHEISHVRAQSQGIGMGHSGLYQNTGLEHQADVEGMMAAHGQSILGESTGMDTGLGMGGIGGLTPLGPGMSASAGAPMQAKDKPKGKNKKQKQDNAPFTNAEFTVQNEPKKKASKKKAAPQKKKTEKKAGWQDVVNSAPWKNGKNDTSYSKWKNNGLNGQDSFGVFAQKSYAQSGSKKKKKYVKSLNKKYMNNGPEYNDKLGVVLKCRIINELMESNMGEDSTNEELDSLISNLYSNGDEKDDEIRLQLKELVYKNLVKRREKYGILPSQMDWDDVEERSGANGFGSNYNLISTLNDINEKDKNVKLADEKKEEEYQTILEYYQTLQSVRNIETSLKSMSEQTQKEVMESDPTYKEYKTRLADLENKMGNTCPRLDPKQLAEYKKARAQQAEK